MTYRTAFNQAFVELGLPLEFVEEMTRNTELVMPMPKTGDMPKDFERQFIEFIKKQAADAFGEAIHDPVGFEQKWREMARKNSNCN